MKRSVIFLPSAIRSHVIPALYVADLLKGEYEIHFILAEEVLTNLVVKHGHKAIPVSDIRFTARHVESFVLRKNGKVSKWSVIRSILKNELYYYRQGELSEIVDRINPAIIFIDIFNSAELIALYSKYSHLKIIFLNPMLSTYRVQGYPAVMEGFWPDGKILKERRPLNGFPIRYYTRNPFLLLVGVIWDRQFRKLLSQIGLTEKHPIAKNRTHAMLFEGFPECIMAPLELEFSPDIRRPNQEYFGLSILEDRHDSNFDKSFRECLNNLVDRKKGGEKIIYCAFGSYYEGNYKPFLSFINKLLNAVAKVEKIQVVISVNSLVIDTLRCHRLIPPYVHFFTGVPQLEILRISDLHITHGGMGSIKESILYSVPMLVYPLEPRWDNIGNALKVEYHGLGLQGSIHWELASEMRSKIELLLFDNSYLINVRHLRNKIVSYNDREFLKAKLLRLVRAPLN